MPTRTSKIMSLRLPGDFPRTHYLRFYVRTQDKVQRDGYTEEWQDHFIGSWKAIAYRFRSCDQHNRAFSRSVVKFGGAPPEPEQFRQDSEYFAFCVNGFSAIESAYYCLYFLGSHLRPTAFPLAPQIDYRSIVPKLVAAKFQTAFKDDRLTTELTRILESEDFRTWSTIRNILIHRVVPGRNIYGSFDPALPPPHEFRVGTMRVPITQETTGRRRSWLASSLTDLLSHADTFVGQHCS